MCRPIHGGMSELTIDNGQLTIMVSAPPTISNRLRILRLTPFAQNDSGMGMALRFSLSLRGAKRRGNPHPHCPGAISHPARTSDARPYDTYVGAAIGRPLPGAILPPAEIGELSIVNCQLSIVNCSKPRRPNGCSNPAFLRSMPPAAPRHSVPPPATHPAIPESAPCTRPRKM